MFRNKSRSVSGTDIFFLTTYHVESASLAYVPRAQVMTRIDISSRKNTCTAFRTKRNIILITAIGNNSLNCSIIIDVLVKSQNSQFSTR